MITNPRYGWCNFHLGTFSGTPSYLTEVPTDLLECFISYFKNNCGCACFDEEGSSFNLLLTPYDVYVIEEKDTAVLHQINIPILDLAKELLQIILHE